MFDIEGYIVECKTRLRRDIQNHTSSAPYNDSNVLDIVLKKMVFGYMVHHGYCGAAENFAKATNLYFFEDIPSIQNRQRVQKLIMKGLIGDAITLVQELYPTLLGNKPELLFKLQIRNFIEMINNLNSEPQSHPYSIASLMNGNEDNDEKMEVDHKPGSHYTNQHLSSTYSFSTFSNQTCNVSYLVKLPFIPIFLDWKDSLCFNNVPPIEPNEGERQPSRQALEQLLLFGRELNAQNTQDEDLKRQVCYNEHNFMFM